jgi:hypothetical protein
LWDGNLRYEWDAILWNISKHCPALRKLTVAGMMSRCYASLASVSARCPLLESLCITGDISNDVLNVIAKNCHALRQLYLCNCPRVTQEGLDRVLQSCNALDEVEWERERDGSSQGTHYKRTFLSTGEKWYVERWYTSGGW